MICPSCPYVLIFTVFLLHFVSQSSSSVLTNFESQEVTVSFVTRLRHKRNIHENEFHILRVHSPVQNSTFNIHLAKNEHLLSPNLTVITHHGNFTNQTAPEENSSSDHCTYSGVISSEHVQGKVALSACGDEPGFHGVLLTDSGPYALEPVKGKEEQGPDEIVHILTPLTGETGYDGCVTLQAPPGQPYPEDSSADIESPVLDSMHESRRQPKGRGARYSPQKSSSPTKDSTGERTVELCIHVDQSLLESLKKKNITSEKAIKGFVYSLVQTMAHLYYHPSMKTKIHFKIVKLELLYKHPAAINTHHGSMEPFLKSYCKYAYAHSADKACDHCMMLSAVDLRDAASSAAVGVAYVSGACMDNTGCSVIEVNNLGASFVMAHEMGHSLGMGHDGEAKNKDCSKTEGIMGATTGPGQTAWSKCSNRDLQAYIKSNENSRYINVQKNCLSQFSSTSTKTYNFMSDVLPGTAYPLNSQCKLADSKKPVAVTTDLMKSYQVKGDVCYSLFCRSNRGTTANFIHPALDGSECGKGKICKNGSCVKKP